MTETARLTRLAPPPLLLSVLAALPGSWLGAAAYLGLPAPHFPAPVEAVLYGAAIIGAAFLLAWAAEAAQVDINAGLALALLALLAVLPEYAVDFVFAAKCGQQGSGEVCSLALANMTGANRILVGVGWPLVVLVAALAVWVAARQGKGEESSSGSTRQGEVRLAPTMSVEVAFLGIATLYSLTLPLRSGLTLWDSAVYVTIFGLYAWRLSKMPTTEPELLGTSEWVGSKDKVPRRRWYIAMFAAGAVIILLAAEHFAESLVDTGTQLGVDKFLLVQWVAPLASESPELIVACLYAWRLKADDSLGTLLSSKVNQWTLLVGSLSIVYAISSLSLGSLPLDTHQRYELLITAAQSAFAVALLVNRSLDARGAVALLSLFSIQFTVSVVASERTNQITIIVVSILYGVLAVLLLARHRRQVVAVTRDGTVTPFERLSDDPRD